MKEEWRDIAGSDGYQVSDLGQVRSLTRTILGGPGGAVKIKRKGRFIRPQRAPGGGYYVHLGSMKKRPVAHLVLEAFLGPRPPKLAARYIDGNPTNPSARNLYWGKRKRRAGLKRRRIASQPMNSPGMPSGL